MERMITKINEMRLAKLNNAEYTNYMSRVCSLVETATIEKLGITEPTLQALQSTIQKMQDLVSQSRISDITAVLEDLDKKRDAIISYIMAEIKNKQKIPLEAMQKSAISLYNATKNYVGMQNLPNQQETQQINGFLMDCAKEVNAPNVTTLALDPMLQELKTVNDEYTNLTQERTNTEASTKIDNSKTVRQENEATYETIVTMAFVTSIANPTQEASTFVTNINALIEETNTLYNQRKR